MDQVAILQNIVTQEVEFNYKFRPDIKVWHTLRKTCFDVYTSDLHVNVLHSNLSFLRRSKAYQCFNNYFRWYEAHDITLTTSFCFSFSISTNQQ
jgi:hypothetical protein